MRVADAFTSGGAQVAGGSHDRDFRIRVGHRPHSRHPLDPRRRAGRGRTFRSDDASNYLGTYTFTSLAAFDAGQPASYTRRIGNPLIEYWNVQRRPVRAGRHPPPQGPDAEPGRSLRSADARRDDYNDLGPRIGVTWAPFKSGKTTCARARASSTTGSTAGTYEQTLARRRLPAAGDEHRQPGLSRIRVTSVESCRRSTAICSVRDLELPRNVRVSARPRPGAVAEDSAWRSPTAACAPRRLLRGENLNAPVNRRAARSRVCQRDRGHVRRAAALQQVQTRSTVNLTPKASRRERARQLAPRATCG